MVEKQDTDHCSVLGGQQMILTGQNFSSDSKVVFMEKSQGEWAAWGGGKLGLGSISHHLRIQQVIRTQINQTGLIPPMNISADISIRN